MDANNEVLTREYGLKNNVLPTGRKVGVVPVKGSALFQIAFVDGKGGDLPDIYSGRYTGLTVATKDLQKYVSSFWDMSENVEKKNKRTLSINTSNAVT